MRLPAALCKMQRKRRESDGFSKSTLMTPPGSNPSGSSIPGRHSYGVGLATTTTAACGRNREELLGQRPAGCERRARREADAGSRNPWH